MPWGIAAAAAGTIGSSLLSSSASSKSSKNALNYQKAVGDKVNPYIQSGVNANKMLSDPNALMANFKTDPSYQFNMQQGLNAVGTDKAVNGLLRSGGAIKSLAGYASGLAGNQFNNYVNRQQNVADNGLRAAGTAAGLAGNSSNIAMTNGANQGNLDLNMGNAFNQAFGSLYQKYGGGGSNPPSNSGGGGSSYSYQDPLN